MKKCPECDLEFIEDVPEKDLQQAVRVHMELDHGIVAVEVTLDNIPELAEKTGQSEEDLSFKFLVRSMQGRTLNVFYSVEEQNNDGAGVE